MRKNTLKEMKITLNNRPETIENVKKISIGQLIEYKNYTFKLLVTKINGVFVPKQKRAVTFVKDGDNVTILHLISGG